ncbi:MAG: S-adenosylmethionine:tRNA ribosyltransferase-isomerase [Nitratireductor sp.]
MWGSEQEGRRVIPVGTTSLKIIETAAQQSLRAWEGGTDLFIAPGYKFLLCDGLVTNFHLPKSTLFMLVSALIGLDQALALYAAAIKSKYRFLSYGDSCLLLPKGIRA